MKRSFFFASIFFILWLTGCSLAGDITPPADYSEPVEEETQPVSSQGDLYPLVPPNPENGAPIYIEKCAPCHGPQGLGNGPSAAQIPNPVTAIGKPEVARASIPSEWYKIVRDGNMERFMPGFSSLSAGQRWDVLAYVYMLGISDESLALGEELYQIHCVACHGKSGRGDGPQAVGTTMPDFTNQQRMAGKAIVGFYEAISSGVNPVMPAYEAQLTEEERWALAEYVRWLSFSKTGEPSEDAESLAAGTTTPTAIIPEASEIVTPTSDLSEPLQIGKIIGKVVNGSGGPAPAGLEVTIHGFDEMQLIISDTVTTQPDGTFTLADVAMPVGRSFLATTNYEQAVYHSQVAMVQEGQDLPPLEIMVFESTTDPSFLSVERMHLFFVFSKPSVVQVIELYIISNRGDKTLVSKEANGPVLEFFLPEGATGLQFQDGFLGERYLPLPTGFADTVPVRPSLGEYQVMFTFEMPYDRKLEFSQPVNLPIDSLVVLFPDKGVRLKSDTLRDDGVRDVQGTIYRLYSGSMLEAGSTLSLTLSGWPDSANTPPVLGDRGSLVFGLGALGVVCIVIGLLLYRRNRDLERRERKKMEAPQAEAGEETPESLMDAIIALDDLYQEGRLPEQAYQARRAELKARLMRIRNG